MVSLALVLPVPVSLEAGIVEPQCGAGAVQLEVRPLQDGVRRPRWADAGRTAVHVCVVAGEEQLDALASYMWVAVNRPSGGGGYGNDPREARGQARGALSMGLPLLRHSIPSGGVVDLPVTSRVQEIVCSGEWAWLQSAGRAGCDWATSVVACESGGDQYVVNGPYVGWWQILNGPIDPLLNTIEANIQFVEWQGPEAWRVDSPWLGCSPYPP